MLQIRHFKAMKEIKIVSSDKDLQIFIAMMEEELERRSFQRIEGHSHHSNSFAASVGGFDRAGRIKPFSPQDNDV